MKVYHTSQVEIQIPDIYHGRKNADFGQGFYLTPDLEFAHRWAFKDAVINAYELDLGGLSVHTLSRDTDWLAYILSNRRGVDNRDADVILGPIANDILFDTFGIISSGFLKPEAALQLLQIGPEYTQIVIKTEKAAAQLTWISAEVITGVEQYRQSLKKEQEEYQQLFANKMEEIS